MGFETFTIPACHGIAVSLKSQQTIRIINTHGTQVVDTWAFTTSPSLHGSPIPPPPSSSSSSSSPVILTQLSMPHTRASLNRICPRVGDGLYSNERKKMLEVVEDTGADADGGGGGVHDTLIAACDKWRYEELGAEEGHRSCADNLVEALTEIGIKAPQFTPSPLNLFMNIPIHDDRKTLSFEAPMCKKGQSISLRAEMDLVIAFSACPQDILKINCGEPKDAHFQIL